MLAYAVFSNILSEKVMYYTVMKCHYTKLYVTVDLLKILIFSFQQCTTICGRITCFCKSNTRKNE